MGIAHFKMYSSRLTKAKSESVVAKKVSFTSPSSPPAASCLFKLHHSLPVPSCLILPLSMLSTVYSRLSLLKMATGDYDFKGQNMLGAALAWHTQRGRRQFFTSVVGPAMASYSSGRQSLAIRFQLSLVPMTMDFSKI